MCCLFPVRRLHAADLAACEEVPNYTTPDSDFLLGYPSEAASSAPAFRARLLDSAALLVYRGRRPGREASTLFGTGLWMHLELPVFVGLGTKGERQAP